MSKARETCKKYNYNPGVVDGIIDGLEERAYKYLLNSLYGKFAESAFKSGFVMNPATPYQDRPGWTMLFPGAFLFEQEVPIPHMHVPISTHITSIARRTIYKYMSLSPQIHYCDTDGFSTDAPYEIVGPDLGAIKLEKARETCKKYNYNPGVVDGIIDGLEERIVEYGRMVADLEETLKLAMLTSRLPAALAARSHATSILQDSTPVAGEVVKEAEDE